MADLMENTEESTDMLENTEQESGQVSTENETPEFEPWKAQISEKYRYHEAIKGMKNPTEAVARLVELNEKMASMGETAPIFKENMSEDEWEAYSKSVGVVSKEDVGEENADMVEALQKAGISKSQYAILQKTAAELQARTEQEASEQNLIRMKRAKEAASQELKKEWGDEYADNLAYMSRAIKDLFPNEFVAQIRSIGMTNSPDFAKAMAKVGKMMSDHMIKQGSYSSTQSEGSWDFS